MTEIISGIPNLSVDHLDPQDKIELLSQYAERKFNMKIDNSSALVSKQSKNHGESDEVQVGHPVNNKNHHEP